MGSGDHQKNNMVNFHLNLSHILHHIHHQHNNSNKNKDDEMMKDVPKGCMGILVGHEGEEQLQRFIIPIMYVKHPLFMKLLNEAEEVYGFKHKGPITIPCHVDEFKHVQGLIDEEHHIHHHHHHHQQQHNFLCFKA